MNRLKLSDEGLVARGRRMTVEQNESLVLLD
jgi:hypothetical protein